ncbi:sorbin and SH3 domain-containing protein 1 isoform X10 [Leptidea sinapis]|uniref:sorbin and SH3 domain-containing protein 1 isoform X10 n=1 Tax=Leptidea sinapis TaxID=189913 RepID=UPI0021C4A4A2|nr:sorbin and SH3 domain-containing protein 1 isoform X10 [Leptidea sinapis]
MMTSREVELTGGAPWGFRMHGGVDQNQPLRISRSLSESVEKMPHVNPGRKASLSGIREGDIITSIDGRHTRGMTNSEAHAMLRAAGPSLRLGLNEDKDLSPRRRSIGRSTELKRPSQLLTEIDNGKAIPQAPVYATIRPAITRPSTQPMNSLHSSQAKSTYDDPPKIYPTNPFYTTLPSNYTSASKLPIPSKTTFSTLDRNIANKTNDASISNDKSPLSIFYQNTEPTMFENNATNSLDVPLNKNGPNNDKVMYNGVSNGSLDMNNTTENINNPFETKRDTDTFVKHSPPEPKINGSATESLFNSKSSSGSNFYSKEEIMKHSITEHKISEIEEVKTIKKILLNGSSDANNYSHDWKPPSKEHIIKPTLECEDSNINDSFSSPAKQNASEEGLSQLAEPTSTNEALSTKSPARSPTASLVTTPLKQTVMIAPTFKARSTSPAIWKPGVPPPPSGASGAATAPSPPPPPPPPVWTPNSTTSSPLTPKKLFRPVHFEESPPARKKFENSEQNGCMSNSETESRLRTSQSAPATGLHSLASRLPRVQNPTVTLLQKAREGQVPRTSGYPSQDKDARLPRDRPSPPVGDPVHALRRGYVSEGEGSRSDKERVQTMTDTDRQKIEGVGPTTREGMPVTLRSEVKDPSKWYKKMYDTIHKNKYDNDYVTIRYKSRRDEEPQRVSSSRSQYAYFDPRSGYLSEPEGGLRRLTTSTWSDAYDSDAATGPRRRTASVQEDRRDVSSPYLANNKYSTLASTRASHEVYKTQPGKIENYTPGKSSVVEKEAKQWWDEVMDIFDGWLDENSPLPPYSTLLLRAIHKNQNISSTTSLPQASPKEKKDLTSAILSKSNMARALKESGYESDSTLIFKRREETEAPLSPADRRAAYRDLQAGGEPPLRGFRSPAPPRTESDSAPDPPQRKQHGCFSDSESPNRRYVESDVNIHYRIPVRHDPLPLVPERELARQQAEHMKRLYREQKRNKYLQENDINPIDIEAFDASIKELQDMQNRRHQDNFTPSQKAVVPLNRYDEAEKIVARALYTFNGQTSRELSFKKGELIHVRRQIDNNWYEGEIHGKVGLFPYNYVELLKGDVTQTPKKQTMIEGRARAKFDFTAQTNLELPLKKGEVVVLTRRIDHNWWEGRLGNKMGIFPDSYVTVIQEPSQNKPEARPILCTDKPVAAPAAHGLLNGSDKRSMGSHNYIPQPNSPALANAPPATQPLIGYPSKAAHPAQTPSERGYGPPTGAGVDLNNTEPLYVDTNAEAVPYRAMYKYRPQNPDELELNEGDTVYVLEKCDDGWYVGSSQRTGRFGTFPGNYVERI